jgi:tRNA dimethylallyltransferase
MGYETLRKATDHVLAQYDDAHGEAPLLAFVGPTASGKTALAVEVAARLGTDVISVDSVQIYRHFDLGSGKPSAAELARAPHRLLDVVDPLEEMDASRFGLLAAREIAALRASGKPVVLCGGTFLWLKTLVWGLAEAPARVPGLRARHDLVVKEQGAAALHAELAQVDPVMAARLHPHDVLRVGRALEVFEASGRRLSELQAEHAFKEPRYRVKLFGRRWPKDELRARIEQRVVSWLEQGWVDEVRSLIDRGYLHARAMASVGYRELAQYHSGELSRDVLQEKIVQSTWVFTRRQRTWLNQVDMTWFDPDGAVAVRGADPVSR